jgi:hypothetical protein
MCGGPKGGGKGCQVHELTLGPPTDTSAQIEAINW